MKHHPSKEVLEKFASADLSDTLSSLVSAHIEVCSECHSTVKAFEKSLAMSMYSRTKSSQNSLDRAWESISTQLDSVKNSPTRQERNEVTQVVIGNHKFTMPRSLSSIDESKIKWMSLGGQGKIARIKGNANHSLLLIYLGPNEGVPKHSHSGTEYSYVISGSFTAAGTEFKTGDFAYSDSSTTHSPRATSPDGCLLVSNLEEQLNFFHGMLKPLNRFFWMFLNWKFNRL